MSANLPSTREVLFSAGLASGHRSADILLRLAEMEIDIGILGEPAELCCEHQAAANRLAELHLLIDHLAANLRGGHGVPPTPPQAVPRKGMRPVTHTQARPIHTAAAAPAVPKATKPKHRKINAAQINARGNRSDGLVTRREAMQITGYSSPGLTMAMTSGRIPAPHKREGRSPLWRPEQIAGIHPLRGGGRGPQPADPKPKASR